MKLKLNIFAGSREIGLNPFTLWFSDKKEEEKFREESLHKILLQMRFAAVLGCLTYNIFDIVDAVLFPEYKYVLWILRGIMIPPILSFVPLSFIPGMRKYLNDFMCFLVTMVGVLVTFMMIVVPHPAIFRFSMGIILTLIFTYTMLRIRFLTAVIGGTVIVAWYLIGVAFFSDITPEIFFNDSTFVIIANFIGMIGCYSVEYYMRREYFLAHHIKRLEGLLPICSNCKKMPIEHANRRDPNSWIPLEEYISKKADVDFTHGLCPDCAKKLYGDVFKDLPSRQSI